jgi:L-asparaginase
VDRKAIQSAALADTMVLVRSSRVGNGRVIRRDDYDSLGTIPADNLNPQKARILLMPLAFDGTGGSHTLPKDRNQRSTPQPAAAA